MVECCVASRPEARGPKSLERLRYSGDWNIAFRRTERDHDRSGALEYRKQSFGDVPQRFGINDHIAVKAQRPGEESDFAAGLIARVTIGQDQVNAGPRRSRLAESFKHNLE